MKNEQVSKLYNELKDNFLHSNYTEENIIIETENVIFQIVTLEELKNSLDSRVSTIDLGECENILKKEYNISENQSLIVIKSDIKNEDLSSTVVQYEIYHPISKIKLNLGLCKDVKIVVNAPLKLDSNTISLYDSLSQSGYNLFDSNDDFYNDICSTYTSENGTDMTLEDRKKQMFSASGNITVCQEKCSFELYNLTTKKAKCNCDVQEENTETNLDKIKFDHKQEIGSNFLTTLTNSNFLVLKCYKLAIDFTNFLKNKGRIIISIITIAFNSLIFLYIYKDAKTIHNYIVSIIQLKRSIDEDKKPKLKQNIKPKLKRKSKPKIKKGNKKTKAIKNKDKRNSNIARNSKKPTTKKLKKNIYEPPKQKKRKKREKFEISNSYNRNSNFSVQDLSSLNNMNKKNSVGNEKNININIIPISRLNYYKSKKKTNLKDSKGIGVFKKNRLKTEKNNIYLNQNINDKNLNDEELNSLEYNYAIIYDKRTYFQYYWSLLKKKQLILFTFLPQNDYNILSLKLSLFLLSFSLYFTVNGFFFSDKTMHKIHEDKGSFNILFQIPQILYSSIISTAINMILKLLSLSEKNILTIKRQNNIKIAIQSSKEIEKFITIKFIIFFILGNLLLLFFWYFISCFCAVYNNTQKILIKDTLVSFGLSMAYPFGLNLLPGLFRLPALKAQKKNKKCLYQISGFIALI